MIHVGDLARIRSGAVGAGYVFQVVELGLGGHNEEIAFGANYGPVRVADLEPVERHEEVEVELDDVLRDLAESKVKAADHRRAQSLEQWARNYDARNGAPESEEDR